MAHESTDTSVAPPTEASSIELVLKGLWDKVRRAAEVIARLRVENSQLESTVAQMRQELQELRDQLATREQEIKKLSSEKAEMQSAGSGLLNGEQQAIKVKVQELLGKIESYL